MPPRISPELMNALKPFLGTLGAVVTDVVKRSVEAAVDTALEEVETRVEDVGRRVSKARRGIGRKKSAPAPEDPVVVVEGAPTRRKKKRRRI